MSNNIVEATPAAAPQPSGGAIDKIRKQARQLAYDVRYKVKSKFKEGQKADPASLKECLYEATWFITCTRSCEANGKENAYW